MTAAVVLGAALMVAGCGSTVATSTVQQSAPTGPSGGLAAPPTPGASATPPTARTGSAVTPDGSGSAVGGGVGPGPSTAPAPSGSGSGPTAGAPATAAAVRGPLQVGVLYTVNDGAAPAGINNGNTFSLSQSVHALVDSYNKSGGLGDRHIRPVYFGLHSASSDYEQQIAAACASFTQDNHVAVVLNNTGYYSEQLLTCLSKASVPLVSGDISAPDRVDARANPGFITPITMTAESREGSVVQHLATSGWLTRRNHVGVLIEDCPIDQRIYRNGLAPALARAGVPVASTYSTQCFQSLPDFGTETSQMSNAVVRFRQNHVDMVMVVSTSAEANLVFAFSEVADSQHWYPKYSLSSVAYPEALAQNAAATQMTNMRGVGWVPILDTEGLSQAQPNAAGRECVKRMHEQGVQPQSNTDYAYVLEPCDSFAVVDAILRATNGDASLAAILRGTRMVADSFEAASTVDGAVRVWGDGRLGAARGRLFAFVSGAFRYTSEPFPL